MRRGEARRGVLLTGDGLHEGGGILRGEGWGERWVTGAMGGVQGGGGRGCAAVYVITRGGVQGVGRRVGGVTYALDGVVAKLVCEYPHVFVVQRVGCAVAATLHIKQSIVYCI